MERVGIDKDDESWEYNDYMKVHIDRGAFWSKSKFSKILVYFKIQKHLAKNAYAVVFDKNEAGRAKIATVRKDRGAPIDPEKERPGFMNKIKLENITGMDVSAPTSAKNGRKLQPCGRPGCDENHFRRNCLKRCAKCNMRCRTDIACADYLSDSRKERYVTDCANLQVAEFAVSLKAANERFSKMNEKKNKEKNNNAK